MYQTSTWLASSFSSTHRVTQDGQASTRVAQALGMSKALLGLWVRTAWAQAARPAGSKALEQENKQLWAQLARAKTERNILNKALTIFSQPTN